MPNHDIIVIGASAGGVEAMLHIARHLPRELPAAVFVVTHISPMSPSVLPTLLNRVGKLRAVHPRHDDPVAEGFIYVAPPDLHLVIAGDRVHVVPGPRENGHRPAVDPLFRSAALYYGPRVIGVVLTGNLDDGSAGLAAIKQRGGIAVVQDPEDAVYSGMPQNALRSTKADHVVPLAEIPALLVRLVTEPAGDVQARRDEDLEHEVEAVEMDTDVHEGKDREGRPTGLTCPECHGALWEADDTGMLRFRCRVGHAYGSDTLASEQAKSVEAALWVSLRSLEEHAALARRLATRAREAERRAASREFEEQARHLAARAEVIRRVLRTGPVGPSAHAGAGDVAAADREAVS